MNNNLKSFGQLVMDYMNLTGELSISWGHAAALSQTEEDTGYSVHREGDGYVVVQNGVGTVCFCFADDGGIEANRIAMLLSGSAHK